MYLFTVAVAVIAVARVSELPLPVAEGPLEPEVVELTEAGDVLRRWPIPVDLIVAGVGKEQILVSLAPMLGTSSDRAILVSPRGAVALTRVPPRLPEPVPFMCPLIRDFGESAYLRCFQFRDLSSGEVPGTVHVNRRTSTPMAELPVGLLG